MEIFPSSLRMIAGSGHHSQQKRHLVHLDSSTIGFLVRQSPVMKSLADPGVVIIAAGVSSRHPGLGLGVIFGVPPGNRPQSFSHLDQRLRP